MYYNLHTHTEYSNIGSGGLDCLNKLSNLVKAAREMGISGLAITDHDCLSNAIDINRMQKQLRKDNDDFKLIQGNEIYLVDKYDDEDKSPQKYYHFILIAKDKIGYDAIVELSTRAWYRSTILRGRRRVPTLKSDVEEVMTDEVKGHVIASTACIGGELGQLILEEKYEDANNFIGWCIDRFGINDFYLELQPSKQKDQICVNRWIAEQSQSGYQKRLKTIITTDAHYEKEKDFSIFEAFLRSQQEGRQVKEYYDYARLMEEKEIFSLLEYLDEDFVKECLDNTCKIAESVEFYDLAQPFHIPRVQVPEKNFEHAVGYDVPVIQKLLQRGDLQTNYCLVSCLEKLQELGKYNEQYLMRLEEEADVFEYQSQELNSNFFAYFNTMQHYLDLMWDNDSAVGPSRGSASGSLICYLMGIVKCDPIEHNLPFWRFANKVRATILDIDIDSCGSKRQDIIKAVKDERGELGITQVATFRTLTLKAAIGNAGRGYRDAENPKGLDPDIIGYISSLIEQKRGFVATLKQTLEGDVERQFNKNHNFIKECIKYPGLLEIIEKFEGTIVGSGTHAAAVILFDDEDKLTNHCAGLRSPNGDFCTCLDLHQVEEVGCIKYDWLLLSTLDVQKACFDLLKADGLIDKNLSLRECFDKYLDPNKIDYTDERIWKHLYDNDVLSVFQFDAASGRRGVLKCEPDTLAAMTAVNGLIRLMTAPGQEDQIERFVRIKNNPEQFEEEMKNAGLTDEQRAIMHRVLDRFNGCAVTQESFMILSQELVGYELKDADMLRKTVAKKQMRQIENERKKFWEFGQKKGCSEQQIEYFWRICIEPSLGYGFSENHALPYSIIGVQCILMNILFPPIYWQTAVLLQRSGALDGKTADYNKIAKAVSSLMQAGVQIKGLNINESKEDFSLKADKNEIYFGFNGTKGIDTAAVEQIFEHRPFVSFEDFMDRTKCKITSIVALIKGGAFDEFESRESCIEKLCEIKADTKAVLNGRNLLGIARNGLWPKDTEELNKSYRVFAATQMLKSTEYKLNDKLISFLDEYGYPHNGEEIDKDDWKQTMFDPEMIAIKQYLKDNQEKMLDKYNSLMEQEWIDKYFPNKDLAQWEIEVLGITFKEHPLNKIKNVVDFNELSTEPIIERELYIKDKIIPIYELSVICGIAIAKDKQHSSITLLTPTGPVEVKFRKEQFAHYDAQISQVVGDKKKIIERSWFNRGNKLIIMGMRQEDLFMAKKYSRSAMSHVVYRIEGFENDKPVIQKARKSGKAEEDIDGDS